MKAAVFQGAGRPLAVEHADDPEPQPHEVVVRVCCCGICTSDLHMTEADGWLAPGSVLGHEFAGEVVATGRTVTQVKIGDHVAILPTSGCGHCAHCLSGEAKWCVGHVFRQGGYAEYALAAQGNCIPLPATVSLNDGALIEPLAVALHGAIQARIEPGARVLVLGAGPIGLAAMLWARRLGAVRVAAAASSRRHANLAEKMGVDAFLIADDALDAEAARTLGGPPDVVLECTGARGLIDRAISLVRPRGTVGVLGFCTTSDSFSPAVALSKEVSLQFSMTYGRVDFERSADLLDRDPAPAQAMVTDTVGLDDLPVMFETLRGRTSRCKVLVDPWS